MFFTSTRNESISTRSGLHRYIHFIKKLHGIISLTKKLLYMYLWVKIHINFILCLLFRSIMNITILSISDSDKHFADAIQEYIKRLGKIVTIINLKPVKYWTNKQIIQKETELLASKLEKLKSSWKKIILLSKEWSTFSTQKFWWIATKSVWVVFLIWWPYGLDESMLDPYIDKKISFGQHTMPHGLVKLVLIEQVYRVWMIQGGRKYHW